jgi:hypothetical protein
VNRAIFVSTIAAAIGVLGFSRAEAQFTLIDQSRAVSTSASGLPANGTLGQPTILNTPSDSDSATGVLDQTATGSVQASGGQANLSASQNSDVSAAVLSGQASANVGGGTGILSGDLTASSTYNVDFSVSVATPFSLTEQFAASSGPHQGPNSTVIDQLIFSENSGGNPSTLFTAGVNNPSGGLEFSTSGGPTAYATTLLPGITYTLNINLNIDTPLSDTSAGSAGNASMSFSASVPEPASQGLFAFCAAPLLGRRRRGR